MSYRSRFHISNLSLDQSLTTSSTRSPIRGTLALPVSLAHVCGPPDSRPRPASTASPSAVCLPGDRIPVDPLRGHAVVLRGEAVEVDLAGSLAEGYRIDRITLTMLGAFRNPSGSPGSTSAP